jgi:hypothetical protein
MQLIRLSPRWVAGGASSAFIAGLVLTACTGQPKPQPVAHTPVPAAAAVAVASPPVEAKASSAVEPPAPAPAAPEASNEPASKAEPTSACNEQQAQDFLIRGNYFPKGTPEEIKKRQALHQDAIRYRTERYGYFPGFGKREWAPEQKGPTAFLEDATFFGLKVQMNKRVTPALSCVEAEIKRSCSDKPYQPRALAGIRHKNTFQGGEITNHAYGIAIDIDPGLNTCCGCVAPWNGHPLCHKQSHSEYDRMAMPECWVHAFEKYGFYWLGHDVLKDTMHFEFLGDPDKILRSRGEVASK